MWNMLPESGILDENFKASDNTDTTYRMDAESLTIQGLRSGREAVEQAVYKLLMTERNAYIIYDRSYGIKLQDLYGRDTGYAKAVMRLRLEDALKNDKRILGIKDIEITESKSKLAVSMSLESIYGDIDIKTEI